MTRVALCALITALSIGTCNAENLYICVENGSKTFRSDPCKKTEVETARHDMDRYAALGAVVVPSTFPPLECTGLFNYNTMIPCLRRRYDRAVLAQNAKVAESTMERIKHAERWRDVFNDIREKGRGVDKALHDWAMNPPPGVTIPLIPVPR